MDKHASAQSDPKQDGKTPSSAKATNPPIAVRDANGRTTHRTASQRRRSKKDADAADENHSAGSSLKPTTIEKFKIDPVKSLGEGSYAKVCTATHVENGRMYACKIINDKKDMGNFIERFLPRELKLMRKFNHERVTCVYGIFKTNNLYYILMDYCENGDLLRYLQRKAHALEEDEVKDKALQMLLGIKYLHEEADVAHRDLKCENILIDGHNKLKLADFGFARSCQALLETTEADRIETRLIKDFMNSDVGTLPVLAEGPRRASTEKTTARIDKVATSNSGNVLDKVATSNSGNVLITGRAPQPRTKTATANGSTHPVESVTFCGSVAYAAPEVLSRKSYDPKKYDMWSAGVIVFIMACFFMPFDDSDQAKMVRRQLAKKWRYPPDSRLSDALKAFLEGLMEPSPKERLPIGEALKHRWLRRVYRDLLEAERKSDAFVAR
ncbi:putative Testis-specific serine/threonine-protein kinase 1 [Hypsibius exemplaris]|uniref:Testis-specific serine/threonine-protein kinase 1 n=1 Tax=Hypsibius exemplaris TaxID=2072580 RepID=A0A1W0WMJ1_HYPEX|nr:putative Testis-specific serine/threonine-protein kinase 1 [Hypsibius exemplaris]